MKPFALVLLVALTVVTGFPGDVFALPAGQGIEGRDPADEQPIYDRLAENSPEAVAVFQEATRAMDGGDMAAARAGFERVLTLAPQSANALRRLSYVVGELGDSAAAVNFARQAYGIDPGPFNAAALAAALLRSGDPATETEALNLAKDAAESLPDDAEVQSVLMAAAAASGDADALGAATAKVIELTPDFPVAHFWAGLLAVDRNQWGRAEAEMLLAKELGLPAEAVDLAMTEFNIPIMARIWRGIGLTARLVLAWIVLMAALYLVGRALSAVTLRSAHRPHPHSSYRPGVLDRVLRGFYRGVIGLAVAYFYLSIPLLLLVIVLLVGLTIYVFFYVGRIPVQLLAFMVVAGCATIYAILRSMLTRVKVDEPGKPLPRDRAPELWSLAEEVASHVDTCPVDAIYLTGDDTIAVMERGGLLRMLQGRGQRSLILGLVSLGGLTRNELRSILAHEYGHFSNRDTAGGGLAWRVRVSLHLIAARLEAKGLNRIYNPAWLFVGGFERAFLRITLGASRLHEILADRHAAVAYGAHGFANALQQIIRLDIAHDTRAAIEMNRVVTTTQRLYNLYSLPPIDGPALLADLEKEFQEAINRPTHPYDSHPATAERLELIRQMEVDSAPLPDDGPALDLLPDAERWQWRFTAEVQAQVDRTYKDVAANADTNARLAAYSMRLSLAQQAHDHGTKGAILCTIADLLSGAWQKRQAVELYGQAAEAYQTAGDRAGEAHALHRRAATLDDLEEPESALSDYDKALQRYLEVGDTSAECRVRFNMAMLLEGRGKVDSAEKHLQRVIELEEACQDPDLEEDRAELERVREKAEMRRAARREVVKA